VAGGGGDSQKKGGGSCSIHAKRKRRGTVQLTQVRGEKGGGRGLPRVAGR